MNTKTILLSLIAIICLTFLSAQALTFYGAFRDVADGLGIWFWVTLHEDPRGVNDAIRAGLDLSLLGAVVQLICGLIAAKLTGNL